MGADESGPEVRAEPFGQAAIRPTPDSPVSEEQRGKTVRTDEQTSDSERAREGDKLRLGSDLVTYVLRRVVPVPVPFPVLPASRCHRNSGDDHRRVLRNQYVVRRVDLLCLSIGDLEVEVCCLADFLQLEYGLLQVRHRYVQSVEGDRVEVEAALELVVHGHLRFLFFKASRLRRINKK